MKFVFMSEGRIMKLCDFYLEGRKSTKIKLKGKQMAYNNHSLIFPFSVQIFMPCDRWKWSGSFFHQILSFSL